MYVKYLEKADPFLREKIDGFEHDGADAHGLHIERVEGRSGVGLARVGQLAVDVNLKKEFRKRHDNTWKGIAEVFQNPKATLFEVLCKF